MTPWLSHPYVSRRIPTIVASFAALALWASPASAQKGNKLTATAAVKGPVTIRVSTISGDVVVRPGNSKRVSVTIKGGKARSVSLVPRGKNELAVQFGGLTALRTGKIKLEVPVGSTPIVTVVSGDVSINGVNGGAKIRVTSGDVSINGVKDVDIASVSGDIDLRKVSGAVRLRTVSGDVDVRTMGGAASRLEFQTTSGELDWYGRCGKGCRMKIQALSGETTLHMLPKSDFRLDFTSFSGSFDNRLGLKVLRHKRTMQGGGAVEARLGSGLGRVRCSTFSGEITVKKK